MSLQKIMLRCFLEIILKIGRSGPFLSKNEKCKKIWDISIVSGPPIYAEENLRCSGTSKFGGWSILKISIWQH